MYPSINFINNIHKNNSYNDSMKQNDPIECPVIEIPCQQIVFVWVQCPIMASICELRAVNLPSEHIYSTV